MKPTPPQTSPTETDAPQEKPPYLFCPHCGGGIPRDLIARAVSLHVTDKKRAAARFVAKTYGGRKPGSPDVKPRRRRSPDEIAAARAAAAAEPKPAKKGAA
jgi:hypothetical protein